MDSMQIDQGCIIGPPHAKHPSLGNNNSIPQEVSHPGNDQAQPCLALVIAAS